jgi:hypothetical protein
MSSSARRTSMPGFVRADSRLSMMPAGFGEGGRETGRRQVRF